VHSGADLSAAIDGVLGYDAGECKGRLHSHGGTTVPLTATALAANTMHEVTSVEPGKAMKLCPDVWSTECMRAVAPTCFCI
jgi:hypothetical protein